MSARRNPSPPAAPTSGPIRWNTTRITNPGDYEVTSDDVVIVVVDPEDDVRVVLPAAGTADNRQIWVKRFSSDFEVTIVVADDDPIDEDAAVNLDVNGAGVHLASDGVHWMILS